MTFPRRRRLATVALVGVASSFVALPTASAFRPSTRAPAIRLPSRRHRNQRTCASALNMADNERFELMVDLPGEGLSAQMRFSPVLDVPSEIIEVRYAVS